VLLSPSQRERTTDVLLSRETRREMTIATTASTITNHETAQVERANATRATPVVFVHGLWLLLRAPLCVASNIPGATLEVWTRLGDR
jgi:hypothetical protein